MQELKHLFEDKTKSSLGKESLSKKQELQCFLEGTLLVFLFSYFFYRSYFAVIFLSPLIYFYRDYKKTQIIKSKTEHVEQQFKEAILAVQTNMQAGYSIENAFVESYQDVVRIYGVNSQMGEELYNLRKGMKNGITLEKLLVDLGNRYPDSEIAEFAEVYSIACKTGNQWNEVISKTVSLITQKIEIKEEIEILIHGKKVENRVMCVIPFFILLYMDVTSKGYFDVLYHNILGIMIMTVCMSIYIFAYLLAQKVTEIK